MDIYSFIVSQEVNVLFLCKFGSHLYGTNTPNSDEDYKGVYLPRIEDCITGDVKKSITYHSGNNEGKNSKDDIDIELYSLQYFISLLEKGDTGAIDMLHAPINAKEIVLVSSDTWEYINAHRSEFYTTNLSAFVGYCRTQASKYGIKGSRLNAAKAVMDFLKDKDGRLCDYDLPEGEHIHMISADESLKIPFPMYQVCGKKFQVTVKCSYAYESLNKFYLEYGKRAQLAADNKGVDWKAVSHALRCAYEMKSIYRHGDITFPLAQAEYLTMVKNGERDYKLVAEQIENLMDQIENLTQYCGYPKKIDIKRWKEYLIKIYNSGAKE